MTINTSVRKFRWFWAWQDEQEEAWLGEMSRQGLHLSRVGAPGNYYFSPGEPRTCSYRLDYRNTHGNEREDYLQLFGDAGWEHVWETAGWHYFRKESRSGETEQIFTDTASKVDKYRRLLLFLCIMIAPVLTGLTIQLKADVLQPWMTGVSIFFMVVLAFFIFAMVRIGLRMRSLKKS